MKFVDRRFAPRNYQAEAEVVSDVEFVKCVFEACSFGMNLAPPERRAVARRLSFKRCAAVGMSMLGKAIVEDVEIDTFATKPMFVFGAVFRHVRITGRCGSLFLAPVFRTPDPVDILLHETYAVANAEYYASVDWALDISAAEFEGMEIRGAIPPALVRRDADTQMVARLETVKATETTWRALDLGLTPWKNSLELMMASDADAFVLVAPKRSKHFKPWLAGLQLLRREGILDPD